MGITVTKIGQFNGHRQSIYALCDYDERHVISGGSDGMLVLWDTRNQDGTLLAQVPEPFYCLRYFPEEDLLYGGTRNGTLYGIQVSQKRLILEARPVDKAIFDVYREKDLIWIGLENGDLMQLEAVTGKRQHTFRVEQRNIRRITNFGDDLLLSCSSGNVHQFNKLSKEVKTSLKASEMSVFTCIEQNGQLLTAGRDARIHRWEKGSERADINAHWYTINDLQLDPSGTLLASCSMDKSIKLWDADSLELLKVIDRERLGAHTSSVNRLVWLNEQEICSCSDDRSIQHFRIERSI